MIVIGSNRTKVVEIENHKTLSFEGNYTEFSRKKEAMREIQYKHYMEQQKEIRHHEAAIDVPRSYNREALWSGKQTEITG